MSILGRLGDFGCTSVSVAVLWPADCLVRVLILGGFLGGFQLFALMGPIALARTYDEDLCTHNKKALNQGSGSLQCYEGNSLLRPQFSKLLLGR